MSLVSTFGIDVQKNNHIPYGSYLKTIVGIIASRDVFVNMCYYIDKSNESIYAYWFKVRGVNDESVDDCIAVAISNINRSIDKQFESKNRIDTFLNTGMLIM